MNARDFLFLFFAALTAGGAIAVVLSQNVARMAFWLILSLGSTAGLFFLLNADFVGTAQLLVYVGGTLVLLIFGVMLTASGPYVKLRSNPGEAVLAGVVGIALLGVILSSVCSVEWGGVPTANTDAPLKAGYNLSEDGNTTRSLGLSFLGLRVDKDLVVAGQPHKVGPTSQGYLLPFEIASVHLLVVLIGAAYLARAKRRQEAPAGSSADSPGS